MEIDGTSARTIAAPNLLATALAYAAKGIPVFPLKPGGKVPVIPKAEGGAGFYDATTDEATIRRWWKRWPRANIGMPTGILSGRVLLEIDPRHGGSLDELAQLGGPIPDTLLAQSGGGGWHFYFQHPGGIVHGKKLFGKGDAYEVKADGGYVVLAPSVHPSGNRYAWQNRIEAAPMPGWLSRALAADEIEAAPRARATGPVSMRAEDAAHWLEWAMQQREREGDDKAGYLLAQQLLANGVDDPDGVLMDYAERATRNPSWPFTGKDIQRWITSASRSRIGQGGEKARGKEPRKPKPSRPRPIRPEVTSEPVKEPGNMPPDMPPPPEDDTGFPPEPDETVDEPTPAKGEKGEKIPLTKMLADAIAEAGEHFAVDVGGKLWAYQHGCYRPKGEQVVYKQVKRLLTGSFAMPQRWTRRQQEEVVAYISVDAPMLWEKPPLDRINVANGLLNVETRHLEPHTPDFLSPVQLPVTYDPKATCPYWERFVEAAFPEDARILAWEIVAWLMTPDTRIQKAALLLGEGGNGKSTYLTAVKAYLGVRNTSAMSLQRLEVDRFAVAMLVGKLANICADLPSEALAGTSTFKAVTGGDSIPAEYKFRDSFDFVPFSRLIFSANQPPRSGDTSEGFYDRWLAIPFVGRFRGSDHEIDRGEMDRRLADPSELSGVLNKALEVLPRLRKTGRFSDAESTRKALAEFREITDPFSIWIENHTQDDPEAVTACDDLRKAYNQHANKVGHNTMTAKAFTIALRRARPRVEKQQRSIRGTLTWCYVGIRLPLD